MRACVCACVRVRVWGEGKGMRPKIKMVAGNKTGTFKINRVCNTKVRPCYVAGNCLANWQLTCVLQERTYLRNAQDEHIFITRVRSDDKGPRNIEGHELSLGSLAITVGSNVG